MPLTVRVNGKFVGGSPTPNNQVQASWWNDFRDLLTGVMTDQPVTIANSITGKTFFANGALSSGNKAIDLQQTYAIWSDNTASTFTGGTTRLWVDAPNLGEMHFGGRSSANVLAGIRFRTANVTIDSSGGTATPGQFTVQGGIKTSLDAGKILTSGGGALTLQGGTAAHPDSLTLINPATPAYATLFGTADPGAPWGAGFYAYDSQGAGFIFQNATKSGMTINGGLTLGAQGGNVLTATAVGAGYGQFYWHSKDNLTPEFSWTMDSRPAAPLAMQIARQAVNGFTFLDVFHVDLNGNILNPAGAGIPTTRNGVATSVPIYTGTNTPVSPPVGAIWIKA